MSWIDGAVAAGSDFTIHNLPFGVYRNRETAGTICVAIGEHVMDLRVWSLSLQACELDGWTSEVADALQQV